MAFLFCIPVTQNDPSKSGEAKRENRLAAAALIASNIGFVMPVVGGVVGILFGIIAFLRTRDPRIGGRGLSIAAIVCGIVSIIVSLLLLWSLYSRTRSLGPV